MKPISLTVLFAFISLILAFSCTRNPEWALRKIQAKRFSSYCLNYQSKDPVNGIDIQIIRTKNNLSTYLQTHSQWSSFSEKGLKKLKLKLISNEEELIYLIEPHEGNQRIALSEEIQSALIELLNKRRFVCIEVEGFSEKLQSGPFLENFKKIQNLD